MKAIRIPRGQSVQARRRYIWGVPNDLFPALDRVLESGDPAAGLDFLVEEFLASGQYSLVFEARLMRKRFDLGLPLIQTESVTRDDYQQAVVEAAREAGRLYLAAGNIERGWPYFRAISETAPVADAIARVQPGENTDGIIAIALQEGVNPLKGLELILAQHGMCRAITSFGMYEIPRDRDKCIALLANSLYAEIVERMARAVEAREGSPPAQTNLIELMSGRDWLFGEWDYYVDTSHLLSIVPYCVEVTEKAVLETFAELCEYGRRLSPQFQSAGVPPFEDQCVAYGHYVQALLGNDVERHLDYFQRKVAEADPEAAGDAPGRALVKLLVSLNRHEEALQVLLDNVFEDAPYGAPVPSALSLCYQAKDFARMKELARNRGDLLSYAASSIMVSTACMSRSGM
jgi:hypothetical protein